MATLINSQSHWVDDAAVVPAVPTQTTMVTTSAATDILDVATTYRTGGTLVVDIAGNGKGKFADRVSFIPGSAPTVVSSTNTDGAPGARVYTSPTNALLDLALTGAAPGYRIDVTLVSYA